MPPASTLPTVPNKFPRIEPGPTRLACIGEAPGADEVIAGEPFVGASGRFLRAVLANNGAVCDQVFFGNVCQHNPPNNDIEKFDFEGPEITSGLAALRADLSRFRPSCILILGKTAFRAFRPDLCYPTKKGYVVPTSDWRGSPYGDGTGWFDQPVRCINTFHPAYILRAYADAPLFRFDVARAVRYARNVAHALPIRGGTIRPSLAQVLEFIADVRAKRTPVTWDIEGYPDDVGITMLSLVTSGTDGIVIPFWLEGRHYWSESEEPQVWYALAQLLADPDVPKTAHQAFYELFVSAWRHRLVVNNLRDDTMMKHWECFPELERSLALCTSIYTEQPFYKDQRLATDTNVRLRYNLTDSQVTHEVNGATHAILAKYLRSLEHYRFNINLIPAYNYIMLRGCKLDLEKAQSLRAETEKAVAGLSAEIESTLGRPFNVKSVPDKQWLLYTKLGYKPLARWGKSTAEDVLLHYWVKSREPVLRAVIQCIRKRTRLSDINKLVTDEDGRIRSAFDPVGTNTGRLTSRASMSMRFFDGEGWQNTGTNLQNQSKEVRACFVTDDPETFDFWQVDLSGADGWTVAADLAALGWTAMLEDYRANIKPALVLYYMLQEQAAGRDPSAVNRLDRTTLKTALKAIKADIDRLEGTRDAQGRPGDWQYLCCKRVQHGSNYGGQPAKISEVIFGDSDGAIDLSVREATQYQQLYKMRYQTDHRNEAIRRKLCADGSLVAACGIRRQFFGIRNRYDIDDAIIREASAFEPQANTTYVTNKALERLWYDESNRTSRGTLRVDPLLQIHDALAGQFPKTDREWACTKLREWFTNPLRMAGLEVTIPAEGKYGPNWKETKTSFL